MVDDENVSSTRQEKTMKEPKKSASAHKGRKAKTAKKQHAHAKAVVAKAASPKAESSDVTAVPLTKVLAGLLIVAVLFGSYMLLNKSPSGGIQAPPTTVASAGPTPTPGAAKLEFYVMSKCPYGTQVLDAIAPVLKKLGNSVDFRVNYIANDNGDGTFSSLHGQTEVDENIRELCAMKYYSNNYQYMDYITCRDKNIQSTEWQSCADQNGMDSAKIKACAEGQEGKNLLSASIVASNKRGAQASPTIFLNGQAYQTGRKESDFTRAICNTLSTKPDACNSIPEPVKFNVLVLNDVRCKDCDTKALEGRLLSMFPGASFRTVDYSSPEGQSLYSSTKVTYLPALLFDQKVTTDEGYKDIQRYFQQAGDYLSLMIGAGYDPYCDASPGHCSEQRCASRLACRPDVQNKLDVFVMSRCPYGVQALNSMKEVLNNIKNIKFGVHYIASYDEATATFTSLHGPTEVDDNIRELCAMKYYPDNNKFMDFIWCRNTDFNADWTKCVTDNGMDVTNLKACADGAEGKNLLKEDLKLAEGLQIGASPTWLTNNKYQFSGISAQDIKTNYCQRNSGIAGCEKTLSGDTGGVPASGGCG